MLVLPEYNQIIILYVLQVCVNNACHTHLNLPKPAGAETEKHSTSFSSVSQTGCSYHQTVPFLTVMAFNSPPPFPVQGVV